MKRTRLSAFVIAALVFAAANAGAYDPPAGAETAIQLVSPAMMAGGWSAASIESPMADLANPAASGLQQRTALDLSYIALVGMGEDRGWGHVANFGMAVPKPYGVWTGAVSLLSSPFESALPLGTIFTARGGMAKDLYPNFLVGAAIDAQLGGNNGFGWGLAADIGVLSILGNLSFLRDFAWGLSLRNMGKAFSSTGALGISGAAASSYDSPFTLQAGASAELLPSNNLGLSVKANSDLWFPSFQNVVLGLGLRLSLKDKAFLRLGWDFNLREAIAGVDQGLLPSIGIGASFTIDKNKDDSIISKAGLNRSELRPSFAAAELPGKVWAFGMGANIPVGVLDRNPPQIKIKYPDSAYDAYYISPNNDGVKDQALLALSITDQRYVKSFSMNVLDGGGNMVKTISNKESRSENLDVKGLWDRLIYVKKGVDVPSELVWNGLADSGDRVPDGSYSIFVEAMDDNGNRAETKAWLLEVDTQAPVAEIVPPGADALIFSPDGDGNKDSLAISQKGSKEDLWTAEILDAGGSVQRSWAFQNSEPASLVWDGKNNDGQVVPDGVYAYRVYSEDRAGNKGQARIDNIIVNTQQAPVGLSIDMAFFSPNGDGIKDELKLSPNVPVKTGMESWALSVLDASAKEVWARSGNSPESLEASYKFDGKSPDGSLLPEGSYRARLSVIYVNGHRPVAYSPNFVIDVSPPVAKAELGRSAFNPLGLADRSINIRQSGTEEDSWTGEMLDANGKAVKSWKFLGKPDPELGWDGSDDAGKVVADGLYSYRLFAQDKAGNQGFAETGTVLVDTGNKAVRLSLDKRAFSPNGDSVLDTLGLMPESQSKTAIKSWTLGIFDSKDQKVKSFAGSGALQQKILWDGRNDAGSLARDGNYYAMLEVSYVTGEVEKARSVEMALDTVSPSIELSIDYKLFSPNGDGRKDSVTIKQSSLPGDNWYGRIEGSGGRIYREWSWKNNADSFSWDGNDGEGNRVPDGVYSYVVKSEDPAGNSTAKRLDGITVDTRAVQAFVTASAAGFSPNGDGKFDDIAFGLVVKLNEGIDVWSLSMLDSAGKARRVFGGKGSGSLPSRIVWDGKAEDGSIIQGQYSALFAVDYLKGDRAEARSPAFVLDSEGPKVALKTSPKYFSPDNDGVDDELLITLAVSDASDIDAWNFEIGEQSVVEGGGKRSERVFFTWTGRGSPAERLVWDGRSQKGELVESATDYPYRFTISDVLGNTTVAEGLIAVDVLVIKDGDRLKIKVPSIVFRPNFADFKDLPADTLGRNEEVLKRIAQILNRFRDYKIRVEGHANSIAKISGAGQAAIDKEENGELLPLSQNRAQLVMQKLVEFGVDAKRLSVRGLGSSEPVVAFTDAENRWKNRRVEFILLKE